MEFKVEGLERLLKKLSPEILAEPLKRGLTDLAHLGEREAKKASPIDTGRLRSSITTGVDTAFMPLWSKVKTDVTYGVYMEMGTRPHWPPPGALAGWARRHGISEFLVARAIARKGTKARKFFGKAKEAVEGKLETIARRILKEIGDKFGD